jgi:hypothetical protein
MEFIICSVCDHCNSLSAYFFKCKRNRPIRGLGEKKIARRVEFGFDAGWDPTTRPETLMNVDAKRVFSDNDDDLCRANRYYTHTHTHTLVFKYTRFARPVLGQRIFAGRLLLRYTYTKHTHTHTLLRICIYKYISRRWRWPSTVVW